MREKNLETCLVIATGLVIAWFFFQHQGLLIAAATIGIIGAFFNPIASQIHWVWYKIAEVMGMVMSKVILSAVFFLLLFPIAFIYRLFNKDSLQLKRKEGSYWSEPNKKFGKKDLVDMW